ncbi:MAG: hypothetical protein ACEPOV_14770 [Hyphomicrobiales bacterium]
MNLKYNFESLEAYGLDRIFTLGLKHSFENVKRVYLDELNVSGISGFLKLIDYTKKIIKPLIGDEFFICFVSQSDKVFSKSCKRQLSMLTFLGLKKPSEIYMKDIFLEEEERFMRYLFFLDSLSSLETYIWGALASEYEGVNITPYIAGDIFIISQDLRYVINIYDDRGLDILKLY